MEKLMYEFNVKWFCNICVLISIKKENKIPHHGPLNNHYCCMHPTSRTGPLDGLKISMLTL